MRISVFTVGERVTAFATAWLFGLVLAAGVYAQTDPGPVDSSTRESARNWFNTWWPKTYGADIGFTGDVANGVAGDTSQAFKDQTLLRINLFRRMIGGQPVVFNPTWNAKDQLAALMMSANGALNHSPPTTWKFYSADGFSAANQSSLAWGACGSSAVLIAYLYDQGADNEAVGHRSDMLWPPLTTMATGDVPASTGYRAANALWVSDGSHFSTDYRYGNQKLICWPPKGYVPHYLIPGRWNFSTIDAASQNERIYCQNVTVTVTRNGVVMPNGLAGGHGVDRLTWTLDGTTEGDTEYTTLTVNGETFPGSPNVTADVTYHVTIDGIQDNTDLSLYTGGEIVAGHYEYDVIGYNPDVGPSEAIITSQPSSAAAITGGSGSFAVQANNAAAYQWFHDGAAIAGATGTTLLLTHLSAADAGNYTAVVTGAAGPVSSNPAALTLVAPSSTPAVKLINISTRSFVSTGGSIQIAGFVIGGTQPKTVLIRASGPALALPPRNVSGTLADPVLTVFDATHQIAQNDDWSADPAYATTIEAAVSISGAFGWTRGSKDAAVVLTLQPGAYTAQVSGKNGATGVALVEVYQADSTISSTQLINLSTRSLTQSGANIQIAGFVINGTLPKTVLIRAAGPALALPPSNVSGTLADPVLTVFDTTHQIAQNDDWSSDPAYASTIEAAVSAGGAFAWARGGKDAAIVMTLAPGAYTAQVSSKDGSSGVTLVELYQLP